MTKMSRYALITALAMFLAGCVGQREPAPVEEVKPAPEQPAEPQQPVPTVPSVPTIPQQPGPIEHEDQTAPPAPHIRHYDWNGAMQPMVSKMLGADGVTAGSSAPRALWGQAVVARLVVPALVSLLLPVQVHVAPHTRRETSPAR